MSCALHLHSTTQVVSRLHATIFLSKLDYCNVVFSALPDYGTEYLRRLRTVLNFIDYLGFLIGLKYETITKIANKIQQFPAEIIKNPKHLGVLGVTA